MRKQPKFRHSAREEACRIVHLTALFGLCGGKVTITTTTSITMVTCPECLEAMRQAYERQLALCTEQFDEVEETEQEDDTDLNKRLKAMIAEAEGAVQ